MRKLYILFLQYVLVTYLYLHDLNQYYQRACQNKVKRKKKSWKCAVPLCFPLTLNHSLAQIIHMYRTPYSPAHAAGPSLQMNAPLDIILIKVQSIFSSFACSSISKGFFISLFCLYSLLQPPVVSALQIETGDFKDKGFGVRWLIRE